MSINKNSILVLVSKCVSYISAIKIVHTIVGNNKKLENIEIMNAYVYNYVWAYQYKNYIIIVVSTLSVCH